MSQKSTQELQQMIERLEKRVELLEENAERVRRQLLAQGMVIKVKRGSKEPDAG